MITLNLSPQAEETLTATALQRGVALETLIENIVQEHLPPVENTAVPKISAKNAAAVAMLRQWVAESAAADPDEIRKADAEAEELMQNLNKNRIESGERPLFP